ncbi:aminoacyl tRNA synthase complex-interacting multifunctional protein 1 isoform X2 [Hydra vulgaris]|uniref:Aminoacyl tRNA synthase complex-interacting multifunctional protein 1 isoform X2 n=1 Tax=Hydra vulgaris TaxID=6087 RepID=A0ABM4BFT4_HYDVU
MFNKVLLVRTSILQRKFFMMAEFQQRQTAAEQKVNILKKQLEILKKVAEQKKREVEQAEVINLLEKNARLQEEISKLKTDLRFYEAQNGVKLVSVPSVESVTKKEALSDSNTLPIKDMPAQKEKTAEPDLTKMKQVLPTDDNKPIDASRILMKIGKIIDVKKHPDADSLYVEQVDLGESNPRTIVSGLVKHVPIEHMQNRVAVFVCNLKPAKMRGILSEGMIMCASTPEKVEIIEVPASATIGDIVTCEGYSGDADVQLNPKKKIWEQVQPDFRVDENGVPGYKGGQFTIAGKTGRFSSPTMKCCPIK